MMLVRAIVRSVARDEAIVEVADTGCGRCNEPGGCGSGKKADLFCRNRVYRVRNPLGARAGDEVEISIGDGVVGFAATRAYLVPLLALLAGAAAGRLLGDSSLGEFPGVAGAAIGLAGAWLWLRNKRESLAGMAQPTIIAHVVNSREPCS